MKKNKILLFGISIILIMIVVIIFVVLRKTSPKRVIDEYCNILVDGNFGDILDLAYFPESEFITEDKIEELKDIYYDEMSDDYGDIINCSYTEAKETDETIQYKITIEKNDSKDTVHIEVRKKDNKIMLDGLYKKVELTVHTGACITIDNKEVSVEPKKKTKEDGTSIEIYNFIILDDVKYDLNITHSIFQYEIEELDEDTDYTEYSINCELKDDFSEKLNLDVNIICNEIVTVVMEKGDIEALNQYFVNGDANKLIEENEFLNGSINHHLDEFNYEFKQVLDTLVENIIYIEDNKLQLGTRTFYQEIASAKSEGQLIIGDNGLVDSFEEGFDVELELYWVLEDGEWKIASWD